MMGHIRGAQMGRRSIELLQRASGCPLTHVHVQLACATKVEAISRIAAAKTVFILKPHNMVAYRGTAQRTIKSQLFDIYAF